LPPRPLVRFLSRAESADVEEWSWTKLEQWRGANLSNGAVTRAALQFSATTNQAISPGYYPPSYFDVLVRTYIMGLMYIKHKVQANCDFEINFNNASPSPSLMEGKGKKGEGRKECQRKALV
jgi:hypothetical protein